MGVIEDTYEDLETDVSLSEFREAVEAKVEQMGGLADEETAAMLIAHELKDGEVDGIADVEPGMDEAKFLGKVLSVGELRTFDRDDGEDEDAEGAVVNVEVADETGQIRVAFWNDHARDAVESLAVGDVLRVKGRPKEGYSGVEINADKVEQAPDEEIDVAVQDTYQIDDLTMGLSDVNCRGTVLATESVRTFDRDDGSEGKVANCVLGDPTGRIRVTMWDERADRVETLEEDESVEVVDGYVRERDGDLELHVGDRGAIESVDDEITYVPDHTAIDAVEIGQTVDIAGVVRSSDPKRTFDRDDGSQGQVKNVRVQDDTGDIRVALWGEKADIDLAPGDEVAITDVEIQDGWQDELEASANWGSTVTVLDDGAPTESSDDDASLSSFGGDEGDGNGSDVSERGSDTPTKAVAGGGSEGSAAAVTEEESTEFTGTVVQAGDPVILDDGEQTVTVSTDADVTLGEEITVRGNRSDGHIDADDVF